MRVRGHTDVVLAVVLLIAWSVNGAGQGSKKTGPIRVAVFTTTASAEQFVDPEEHQRIDSVKDLERSLRLGGRVKVVDGNEAPDVLIEIVSRDVQADGGSVTAAIPVFGTMISRTRPTGAAVVRARLSVVGKDYVAEIVGSGGRWGAAANDAAGVIETWVKDYRSRLRPGEGK